MATSVTLQYGIFTGPRVGKKFRRTLKQAGYAYTDSLSTADVIIGHSAGCFELSKARPDQKLVLIDPPYWPGKTARQRAKDRGKSHLHYRKYGLTFGYWLSRTWWGLYYAVVDIPRNRRIIRSAERFRLNELVAGRQTLIIRNDADDWLTPDLDELADQNTDLRIVRLPGDHDNCWFNPKPYIDTLVTWQEPTKTLPSKNFEIL